MCSLQVLEQWRGPVAAVSVPKKNYSSEVTSPRPLTTLTEDELAMKDTSMYCLVTS